MAVRPERGQTVIETKTTTIADPEEPKNIKRHIPMWDFIESLTPDQWNSKEYEIILYRGSKHARGAYCCKYFELIDHDRIKKDFGGGDYNLLMKVPPSKQLRYNEDVQIAGAPKEDAQIAASAPTDAVSQVILMMREELRALREELRTSQGGGLHLEAIKQALALNGQVFSNAATAATGTLTALAGGGVHQPSPMDEMMRSFIQAAIAKMMNPSSPIEDFLKMAQAMNTIGFKMGGPASGGGEKLTDKLLTGLVNQLPVLTQHVSGIMDGYRRAEEAKLNAIAIQRGQAPPINVQPVARPAQQQQPANLLTMPAPVPQAPPAANGEATQEQLLQAEQMLQYIENKIVEILANHSLTPEEAAVQALTFIDITDPVKAHPDGRNLIDQILQYGETGLNHIFSNRTILMQIPKDARLDAFKKAFLENGRPTAMQENLQPNPNLPPA